MRILPLLILMVFTILMPVNTSVAAVPSVGIVKHLRGSVVAMRAGTEVKLKKGDAIFEGDLLKTGKRSSLFAAMKGDENNTIRLGQRSQLEVKKYSISGGQVVGGFLRGLIGIFTVELNRLRKGSSFTMKTPTAVLGVRGTVWGSVVKADGSTTFAVKRGSIAVRIGGKSVLLRKGQTVTVSKSGVASPVTAISKSLEAALDKEGDTFDNAAEEAAALDAAKEAAKEASEALAEAAKEAAKLEKEAKDALEEAQSNPDDAEAQAEAKALKEKAEQAVDAVVDAANADAGARDSLKSAKSDFEKADAGIPVVNVKPSGTQPSSGSKDSAPDASDPTSGLDAGAAGAKKPAVTTPDSKSNTTTGGGGGASAS